MSDRVVRYRIKRLLDTKVVILQANVNPHAIGYPVIADILIEVMPGSSPRRVPRSRQCRRSLT